MKAYICDNCGKREEPQQGYDLPPKGWFSLGEPDYKQRHLCSPDCLCAIAETKRTSEPLTPPPPAPETIEQPLIDPPAVEQEAPREF